MIRARLIKTKGSWNITREDTGKSQPVFWKNIPTDWDGQLVEIEMNSSGQPFKIKLGEIELFNQSQNIPKPESRNQVVHGVRPNERTQDSRLLNDNTMATQNQFAKSPYGFIPLNHKVIQPYSRDEIMQNQIFAFDKFASEKLTGSITFNVENLTYLMISKGGKDINGRKIHDFLRIGNDGRIIIPGSSMRGLIRKSVGILSYSGLQDKEHFDNHALFFRGVAGGVFGPYYQPKFFNQADHNDYKPQAGYLKKENNKYRIYPAEQDANGVQYYKIRKIDDGHAVPPRIDHATNQTIFEFDHRRFSNYQTERVFFEPKPKNLHPHHGRQLKYALVTNYSFSKRQPNFIEGTFINTGPFSRKKHDQWIMNMKAPDANYLAIDKNIVDDYKADVNRDSEYNVLRFLNQPNIHEVPVFFLTDDQGKVISFGHTPLYRIKHLKTIANAVHQNINPEKYDIEQGTFGKLGEIATRVYFNDLIIHDLSNHSTEPTLIKILASPKPTSHQLYLKSGTWSTQEQIDISGTKEYWHKNVGIEYWKDNATVATDSHAGYIKALVPNKKFDGSIRFENLTKIELGAILTALELPANCCYKIGMGKPLGLGTIKISNVWINLDNRKERYTKLLTDDYEWYVPQIDSELIHQECLTDFEKFMLSDDQFEEKYQSLWSIPRIAAYKAILSYDSQLHSSEKWLKETRYMEIEREKDENGNLYRDNQGNPKPKNEFEDRNSLENPVTFYNRMAR